MSVHPEQLAVGTYHDRSKRAAISATEKRLDEEAMRLSMRFGREHEVTRTFGSCTFALLQRFGATVFEGMLEHSPPR